MSNEQILSKEEVHALMQGVESGQVDTSNEYRLHDGVVRPVDFAARELIVGGRMPGLEAIGSRFVQNLHESLFTLLRRSVEISFLGIRVLKFEEYAQSLAGPTSMNPLRMPPLRGTGLFVADARLVSALVEKYFGGDARFRTSIEERSFTPLEARVIQLTLERAADGLKEAWLPVMPVEIEFTGAAVDLQFAGVMDASEVVAVMSFGIDIDGSGGELHLALPYQMLEPIRERLDAGVQGDRAERDERWVQCIREEMQHADVEVHATLVETTLSLAHLLALKPGDVIPVNLPEAVVLRAENVPVFRARVGVCDGVNAVQIVGPVLPADRRPRAANHRQTPATSNQP